MADGMGFLTRLRVAATTVFRGQLSARDAKELVGVFDADAMTAAYGMLARIYGGATGEPPKRGTKEFLQAYSTSPLLRATAERIATRAGAVPWRLYAKKKGTARATRDLGWQTAGPVERKQIMKDLRRHNELREIEAHPFLDAMSYGNPMLTGYAVRCLTHLYRDICGEFYWLKGRNGAGAPSAFWPIPPHWVAETPTPQRPLFRVSHRSWIENIPQTEILWATQPDPADPYGRGSGVARSLSDELDTDEFVAKHISSFFYNRATPNLMVFGEGLSPEVAKQLERRWAAKYKSPEHSARPFFTNSKIDVKEIGQKFKDMELVELRRYERDMVMQTFGIPPEVMGIIENSNRATIDGADYFFTKYVIEPRLEEQREILQQRLIPEYDDRLVVDYVSPVQEDKDFQLKAMQANPSMFTVDEWREMAGHPEKEDGSGKVHMVTFNLLPTERLDEIEAPDAGGGEGNTPADPAEPDDDEEEDDEEDAAEKLARDAMVADLVAREARMAALQNAQAETARGIVAMADKAVAALDTLDARHAEAHAAALATIEKVGQPTPVSVQLPAIQITVEGKTGTAKTIATRRDEKGAVIGYDVTEAPGA